MGGLISFLVSASDIVSTISRRGAATTSEYFLGDSNPRGFEPLRGSHLRPLREVSKWQVPVP